VPLLTYNAKGFKLIEGLVEVRAAKTWKPGENRYTTLS